MKYEYYPKRRTEQERRELNEQILRLLQSEACEQAGVTDEDIFNRYTGDGGLHGLRRSAETIISHSGGGVKNWPFSSSFFAALNAL